MLFLLKMNQILHHFTLSKETLVSTEDRESALLHVGERKQKILSVCVGLKMTMKMMLYDGRKCLSLTKQQK